MSRTPYDHVPAGECFQLQCGCVYVSTVPSNLCSCVKRCFYHQTAPASKRRDYIMIAPKMDVTYDPLLGSLMASFGPMTPCGEYEPQSTHATRLVTHLTTTISVVTAPDHPETERTKMVVDFLHPDWSK